MRLVDVKGDGAGGPFWIGGRRRPPGAVCSRRVTVNCMSKDDHAEERARAIEWLREIEASAAELVEVGDLLFSSGVTSDPTLVPRYQLYTRVKAALSLPPGLERVEALHAAKIGDDRKH
jgi:hypothetical protein